MDWRLPLWALGAVVAYEVLRTITTSAWRSRQERRVDAFLTANKIPHDPFRHTHRVVVKEMVLADSALVTAMVERAEADGTDVAAVRRKVQAWLDEIVPQFNLLAYYRIGYRLGRMFAYGLYHVDLDKANWDAVQRRIPEDACVVLVSNHRSNADFVVTGFMVSKSVQVSYAVGEWARVWPLEKLFKSFGSYFVRRGEKDPLYHRTLESYLQLVTKQGVTQAIFPEGGLSKDGALRPVRLGLLDMMARAKLDPAFQRPLVFVPVGINFDRVLEDEVLVAEHLGHHPYRRRGAWQKARRLVALTTGVLVAGPVQVVRFATGRMKKHGVAAIRFGEPVHFDDWYATREPFLGLPDRHQRWRRLRPFGETLLAQIGAVVPATPATFVCAALQRIGQDAMEAGVDRGTVLQAMRMRWDACQDEQRPMAVGDPYRATRATAEEVEDVSVDIDTAERLRGILRRALDVLERRGLLVQREGQYRTLPGRWPLVQYYGNSIARTPDQPAPVPEGPAVVEAV